MINVGGRQPEARGMIFELSRTIDMKGDRSTRASTKAVVKQDQDLPEMQTKVDELLQRPGYWRTEGWSKGYVARLQLIHSEVASG